MQSSFKHTLRTLFIFSAITLLTSQNIHARNMTGEEKGKLALAQSAYRCGYLSEEITKDYLYVGNKVGTRQALNEMHHSILEFQENMKTLEQSINAPKSKNLLLFMQMSFDELKEISGQPYTLDNAQIALDLSATILEGARFIGGNIKKSINFADENIITDIQTYFESIAKYYMAYQAGIKDDNTIKLMEETVSTAGNILEKLSKDSRNTVSMNQKINKIQRLWSIVQKFYLDIDKGGLPFIVYKTTNDLNKNIESYGNEMSDVAPKGKAK